MEIRKLIVSDEIQLKELEIKDIETIFNAINRQRNYLSEWLPFVEHTHDSTDTRTFIKNYLNSDRLDLTCIILYKGEFAGIIGLKDTDSDNLKTEIGYWLCEEYQHHGIVTCSCQSLINYAFNQLELNRIQIKVAADNIKSLAIPQRLGFTREGIERAGELHSRGFVDLVIFGLLKNEWKMN